MAKTTFDQLSALDACLHRGGEFWVRGRYTEGDFEGYLQEMKRGQKEKEKHLVVVVTDQSGPRTVRIRIPDLDPYFFVFSPMAMPFIPFGRFDFPDGC